MAVTLKNTVNVVTLAGSSRTLSRQTISTPVAANVGGTGRANLSVNSVLVGNGTDPVKLISGNTPGQVLQIGPTGVPEFNTLDAGEF